MKISKEQCKAEVLRLYNEFKKVNSNIIKEHGNISIDTIKRRYGSLFNCMIECGIKPQPRQHRNVSKEILEKEIYRIYKEHGYVSKPLIEKYSEYGPKIISRIYGSFSNMYKELNFKRHPSGYVPTDKELLNELKRLCNIYEFVSKETVRNFSRFSTTCYRDRFGGLNNAKKKINVPTNLPGESICANFAINEYAKYLNEEPELEKTFDWLRNPKTGYKLRLDAYFKNSNIAIEYNGPQHYEIDGYYTKNKEDLEYRRELDLLKCQLLKEYDIKLITIHYKDKVDVEYIKNTLK